MKVLKFGGSSVANPEKIREVMAIVKNILNTSEAVVIFSAFGGVTDELIQISQMALTGDLSYRDNLKALESRHLDAVKNLLGIKRQSYVSAQVKLLMNELEDILHGVFLVKERTARSLDYIMSFGERLSAFIIAEAMKDGGLPGSFLDARHVIRTDDQFGNARVDLEISYKLIRDHFRNHQDLQVVTGFIGRNEGGETTTLGRSGSDYTAALFAGALSASALEIWTDVNGMMTADPRLVKKAFSVPQMSYEEAMELSHFGAKVIFPSTMQPAMANRIPIWIKNTFNPGFEGTVIQAEPGLGKLIKGISSMSNIALLSVQGSGLMGVVGCSMRLFSALARERINVILISQASSEHSICFAVDQRFALQAKNALEREFFSEIRNDEMEKVQVEGDMAIVAVVGEGMKHSPGTSGRMFNALGRNGINVTAIAQGSSELNISAVINQSDVAKSLNVLHEAFFLSDRKVLNVFLVGTGLIGKTLLGMVREQFEKLARESFLEINVVGIANSRKMLFSEDGFDLENCVEKMKESGQEMGMDSFVKRMTQLNLSNSIFIDCTSSEQVAGWYERILSENISIVTPNKKACSGTLDDYRKLKSTAIKRGVKFLYETNVGAGLPVINTLGDLLLSGDKVYSIEAVLSGTLNYIFSGFTEGRKFSEVVKEAREKGFTEPDPRDDLNGMDVARKILILSRETGSELELSDIEVENLVPEAARGEMSMEDFFKELEKSDGEFESMRKAAAERKEKLRYMAIYHDQKVSISLGSVNESHPFYTLSGSDNVILLTTERYHERPMVIRGPGAGAAVTAAGVFADVIRIGNYAK